MRTNEDEIRNITNILDLLGSWRICYSSNWCTSWSCVVCHHTQLPNGCSPRNLLALLLLRMLLSLFFLLLLLLFSLYVVAACCDCDHGNSDHCNDWYNEPFDPWPRSILVFACRQVINWWTKVFLSAAESLQSLRLKKNLVSNFK